MYATVAAFMRINTEGKLAVLLFEVTVLSSRRATEARSLRQLAGEYLAESGGAASTVRAKRCDLNHFIDYIALMHGEATVERCTRATVEDFVRERLAHDSAATVARRLATLKVFFGYVTDETGHKNPAARVRGPLTSEPKFASLTPEQVDALRSFMVAQADQSFTKRRDYFLLELLLHTGLRRAEACDLTVGQIAPDLDRFEAVLGKAQSCHDVLISSRLRGVMVPYLTERSVVIRQHDVAYPALLESQRERYPVLVSTWNVVPGDASSWKLSPESVRRILRAAMLAVGVAPRLAHPHTLRHTFVRQLYDATKDIRLAKLAARHRNVQTTMRYTVTDEDELREALDK